MTRQGQISSEESKGNKDRVLNLPLFRELLFVWLACGLSAGILELAFPINGFPFAPLISLLGIIWIYRRHYPKGLPPQVGGWGKVRIAFGYSFGVGIGVEIINRIFLGVVATISK